MTERKKQKRIVRKRAAETGVSYSVALRNMGIGPEAMSIPPVDATSQPDEGPLESIPRGLQPMTLSFDIDGVHRLAGIAAPIFAVGYAVVDCKANAAIDLQIGKPVAIVFARTFAEQSCWVALRHAKAEYSQLHWTELSAVQNGVMPSAATRYWVQWIVRHPDESLEWDTGARGLHSLDSVLSGTFSVADSRRQQ